jgi:hypothetical protein
VNHCSASCKSAFRQARQDVPLSWIVCRGLRGWTPVGRRCIVEGRWGKMLLTAPEFVVIAFLRFDGMGSHEDTLKLRALTWKCHAGRINHSYRFPSSKQIVRRPLVVLVPRSSQTPRTCRPSQSMYQSARSRGQQPRELHHQHENMKRNDNLEIVGRQRHVDTTIRRFPANSSETSQTT